MDIYLAPLQGYTESAYRNAYTKVFTGIDKLFLPYVLLEKNGRIRNKFTRETDPQKNDITKSVPQVLCNDSTELLFWKDYFQQRGYSEININLGCPYPMVTRKNKGSKLLQDPKQVEAILNGYFNATDFPLSVKMRLGFEDVNDYVGVSEVLNKYPLTEVITHSRTAAQLYKGDVDIESYLKCASLLNHKTIYNGDVNDLEVFNLLKNKGAIESAVMLGRGVLMNPFLPMIIKGEQLPSHETQIEMIMQFHDILLDDYESYLNDDHQVLTHIKPFWDYLSEFFPADMKIKKHVKKASNLIKYKAAIKSF